MSYKTQYVIAQDSMLFNRITACASLEGVTDPMTWTYAYRWQFSAQPGWGDAYASALQADPSISPGDNEAVITDNMILSAVQAILATESVV